MSRRWGSTVNGELGFVDPYVYPGSSVLRNRLGIHDQAELNGAEYVATWTRRQELHAHPITGYFDLGHLRAIHRHLFQDLFDWAGQLRTVEISKGDSQFHPSSLLGKAAEHTFTWLRGGQLLGAEPVDDDTFITEASELLGLLNYMHPFREGNGRTQRAFLDQVAERNDRVLSWRNVSPEEHTRASIETFQAGTGQPFETVLARIIRPPLDGLSLLDDGLYRVTSPVTVGAGSASRAGLPAVLRQARTECGALTTKGGACQRRGHCPYHGGK